MIFGYTFISLHYKHTIGNSCGIIKARLEKKIVFRLFIREVYKTSIEKWMQNIEMTEFNSRFIYVFKFSMGVIQRITLKYEQNKSLLFSLKVQDILNMTT